MRENEAQFRFCGELNDFLPRLRRKRNVLYQFDGHPSVKDSIEAQGVPHTEIDLILINDESVDFSYQLQSGDRVVVYPASASPDISPAVRLRPAPLRCPAFVLDVHLGRLARWLRLLGFDVLYRNDYEDAEIVRIAVDEQRVVLTRDRGLLFHASITHARWLHSIELETQLLEVLDRFNLRGQIRLIRRCALCNGVIRPVAKSVILDQLKPLTARYFDHFFRCTSCGRIYWKGSHYDRIVRRLTRLGLDSP